MPTAEPSYRYGPVRASEDTEHLVPILADAFGQSPDKIVRYLGGAGVENQRVIRAEAPSGGSAVCGGLVLYSMGQWFGGRCVPMAGVAAVGVDAACRGHGAATRMMEAAVLEMHARELALSVLYPAVLPLYRRAGYERAGGHFELRVPTHALGIREPEIAIAELAPADAEAVVALQSEYARTRTGRLERHPFLWHRARHDREGRPAAGYVAHAPGRRDRIEGYVFFRREPGGRRAYDLVVSDIAALTPRAARGLLGLLGNHHSLGGDVVFHGASSEPLLAWLPEQAVAARLESYWMLRVLDVVRALEARGYPAGIETHLDLCVHDDLVPTNEGRFRLRVSAGRGTVERAGAATRDALELDVRALSSLYTGFFSAEVLHAAGSLGGPPAARATATTLFAGPESSMPDMF